MVERNARRLRRLVGDLLVVAQAEAGRLAVLPEDADVAALAAERVAALRPVAAERAIRLQVDAPAPMHAFADPERLGQVLDNLIANAVTHTPDHGVVTVSTRRVGDDALVEVRDTGPGIPTEELERVFERFHRGVRSTRSGGIGLGLPISRAIMRAHGGDLWAESPAGGGAVLTLRLPVGAAAGGVTAPREPGIMAGA